MEGDAERTGRLREIEQIYRARLPELWRVAAAISGSRQAAPDLVQEAFVRAVRRIDSFRDDGPLEGWLWRIVVNVATNSRREPPAVALPEEDLRAEPSPAVTVQTDLAAAMSVLSERQSSSYSCATTPTLTTPRLRRRCRSTAAPLAQP